MSSLTTKQLTQRLERLEKEELVQELLKICTRFREVKQYCQMEFGDPAHQEALLSAAKLKIHKHFFPARNTRRRHRARTSRLRKWVADFRKIAVFPHHIADLQLYWPELAVQYLEQGGYVKDTFFQPTATIFAETMAMIAENDLLEYFRPRIEATLHTAAGLRGRRFFFDALQEAFQRSLG